MKRLVLVPLVAALAAVLVPSAATARQAPLRLFVSVDMEGIGGIGSGAMTSSGGKDYQTGRRLATDEVNTVVAAVFARAPNAQILVNDSHGDHQNLLHTELDPRVVYIQGSIKPLGMVQGLDGSFDGAIFVGYHAKAGDPDGFLAHTGSGTVKGLWLNDVEVGEGGMNAAFAGSHGVPVILAAGDSAATAELGPPPAPRAGARASAGGGGACARPPRRRGLQRLRCRHARTRPDAFRVDHARRRAAVDPGDVQGGRVHGRVYRNRRGRSVPPDPTHVSLRPVLSE
jgi:hypothetical protein